MIVSELVLAAAPSGGNTGQGGSSGPYAIAGIVIIAIAIVTVALIRRH